MMTTFKKFIKFKQIAENTSGYKPKAGDLVKTRGQEGIVTWIGKNTNVDSHTGQEYTDVGVAFKHDPRFPEHGS